MSFRASEYKIVKDYFYGINDPNLKNDHHQIKKVSKYE
jgi:hypothetical protein